MIEPLWSTKPETASRVRGRIESILDWATAREYRTGENPARWRGHLENLLPKVSRVQRIEHHPALPYAEVGAFMVELRVQEGIPAQEQLNAPGDGRRFFVNGSITLTRYARQQ